MATLTLPAAPASVASPRRHRWSVEQYEQMATAGILREDDQVELLEGEIVDKMAIGDPHCFVVKTLNALFSERLRGRAVVSVQDPIKLPWSVPEPDVALVQPPLARYRARKPMPQDLFLVIEVADSSLEEDLGRKARLYAAAGIAEYWVFDLPGGCVRVHDGPLEDGTWTTVEEKRPGAALAPAAFPDAAVDLGELLS